MVVVRSQVWKKKYANSASPSILQLQYDTSVPRQEYRLTLRECIEHVCGESLEYASYTLSLDDPQEHSHHLNPSSASP